MSSMISNVFEYAQMNSIGFLTEPTYNFFSDFQKSNYPPSISKKKKAYYEKVLESECPKLPVKCKGCKKEFLSTTILKHLGHKKSCKDFYQQEEFDSMKEKAKLRKWG